MNLLMILLIVLAIWVCGTVCYFAWQLLSNVEKMEAPPPTASQDNAETPPKVDSDPR